MSIKGHTKRLFIALLFKLAKTWKEIRCPIVLIWIINCNITADKSKYELALWLRQ